MYFIDTKFEPLPHEEKIKSILQSQERDVAIFIDTNILFHLHTFTHESSNQLFNLLKEINVYIPGWVIHEYNKYFLQYLTKKENSLSPLAGLYYSATNLQSQLQIFYDLLKHHSDFYNKDIHNEKSNIDNLVHEIKQKENDRIIKTHDLIMDTFSSRIVSSDHKKILHDLSGVHDLFLEHLIPPGFGDQSNKDEKNKKKDENYLGDRIIWAEILQFCEDKNIKKAIFITQDLTKKDWVYTPHPIINNKSDKKLYCLPLPELTHEFHTKTDSNDFYIIGIELFVKLMQKPSEQVRSLIMEVQENSINEITKPQEDNSSSDYAEVNEIANPSIGLQSTDGSVVTENHTLKADLESISDNARSDSTFVIEGNNPIHNIIEKLKSNNWYTQNDAINQMRKLPREDWSSTNINDWFVLGRNILQSAYGGAFESHSVIANIIARTREFNRKETVILYGICYEIFFDSEDNVRKNLKVFSLTDELLKKIKTSQIMEAIKTELNNTFIQHGISPIKVIDHSLTFDLQYDNNELINIMVNQQTIFSDEEDNYLSLNNYIDTAESGELIIDARDLKKCIRENMSISNIEIKFNNIIDENNIMVSGDLCKKIIKPLIFEL